MTTPELEDILKEIDESNRNSAFTDSQRMDWLQENFSAFFGYSPRNLRKDIDRRLRKEGKEPRKDDTEEIPEAYDWK
jgi:hypothetical protein